MGQEISPSMVNADIDNKVVETSEYVDKKSDDASKGMGSDRSSTKKVAWEDVVAVATSDHKVLRRSMLRRGSSGFGLNDTIGTIHSVNVKSPTSVVPGTTEEQMKAYLVLAMSPEKLQEDHLASSLPSATPLSSESKNEEDGTLEVPVRPLPSLVYESTSANEAGKTTLKEEKSQAGDTVGDAPPMQKETGQNETLEPTTTERKKVSPIQIFFFCFKKK